MFLRAPLTALAMFVGLTLATATSASAAIVVNEVESDGAVDYIELANTGAAAVDIGNYKLRDSQDGNTFTIPGGTMIAGGGFYLANNLGFGLGSGDSARVFDAGNNPLNAYSWTEHAWATYGRCPDGTGEMQGTKSPTPNAANDCFPAGAAWPGGAAVSVVDNLNAFGEDVSGLAYQGSGTSAKGVLWAVRNGDATLFRLVYAGGKWVPDTTNNWGNGKTLVYPNGGGVPDAEGITLVPGDPNAVFVSTERNDDGPNSNTSRPDVLRYDTTGAGTTLTATNDWGLSFLPAIGDANEGLEAIAWVPDSLLVSKGFLTGAGTAYNPAAYAGHGTGLFFVGVEETGKIYAYALNQTSNAFTRVAEIASGFPTIMDLSYDPETSRLSAVCDNSCNGQTKTLEIVGGNFAVTHTYERPGDMPNINNEGYTVAPQAECVGGLKPTFYSDDSEGGDHVLRTGTINCTPLATPDPGTGGGVTPTPTPIPVVQPVVLPDRTAPSLALSLRVAKTVRKDGKFSVVITLGEKADLTISATARKSAKAKARTLIKTTRKGVAAGKPTVKLTLTKKVRKALRKGETLTLTVVARDAAGNVTTKSVKTKVK